MDPLTAGDSSPLIDTGVRTIPAALRSLVDDVSQTRDQRPDQLGERLMTQLVDLITMVYDGSPELDATARAYVESALEGARPAWAAAGRALWALGLWRHGDEDSALLQLVRAEAELAEELRNPWIGRDAKGGPTGPGAASNNLGVAYTVMRLFELAGPHLQRAAEISQALYGPELDLQICIDLANLAEADVRWSFHAESVGRLNEAAQRARSAFAHAQRLAQQARERDHVGAHRYGQALLIGARTTTDPESITPVDLAKLRHILDQGYLGDEPVQLVIQTIVARVARILGDRDAAREAADVVARMNFVGDPTMAAVALREAALPESDDYSWRYAHALAGQNEAARRRAVSAFRTRLVLAGLEQRYERVSADRDRLQEALERVSKEEAALIYAANHDALTGLPNRPAFERHLADSLRDAREAGYTTAVAFLDVDNLKPLNDTHGHAAGDELLRWVGDRLTASLRPQDMLARIGGDEFAVLMVAEADSESLFGWAGRVNDDLNDLEAQNTRPSPVTVSVGVCIVGPRNKLGAAEVLDLADQQMYEAKRAGKGQARVIRLLVD